MSAMQHDQHEHAAPAKAGEHGGGEHGAPAGGGAHEGHGDHGPGDINWFEFKPGSTPYIANVINFAILMWIFWRFGRDPIAKALASRKSNIKEQLDNAQRIKKEAKERAKQYQKKLEHLEEEQSAAKKGLLEAGAAEKQRIVREAEEQAARMERDAKALLTSEIAQIKQDLTRETVDAAVAAAEGLLHTRITPADHERLAETFLQDLAARNAKTKAASSTTPPSGPRGPSGSGGGSARPPLPRPPASVPPRPVPPSSAPPAHTQQTNHSGGTE